MSYREENGQVILTMSQEDYSFLLTIFAVATGVSIRNGGKTGRLLNLLNRLNQGNPHYTPYQTGEK